MDRAARWASERFPWGLRVGLSVMARGRSLPAPLWSLAQRSDPELRGVGLSAVRALVAETYRQGVAGPALDLTLMHGPWGFELREITIPVAFVQGTADPFVPLRVARDMAAEVPAGILHALPARGHLGTVTDLAAVATAISAAGRPSLER
jgi:pimeloyl-ACP methyl ester carboxylesterase